MRRKETTIRVMTQAQNSDSHISTLNCCFRTVQQTRNQAPQAIASALTDDLREHVAEEAEIDDECHANEEQRLFAVQQLDAKHATRRIQMLHIAANAHPHVDSLRCSE